MKLEFSWQIFEKYIDIKFQKNLFIGTRVIRWGRTDIRSDRETEMTKMVVALRNLTKSPKNIIFLKEVTD